MPRPDREKYFFTGWGEAVGLFADFRIRLNGISSGSGGVEYVYPFWESDGRA